MKAILLAAGAGTRCYPFTYLTPKPFQQICGIPLVEYMLSWFGGAPEIETLYIVVRDDSIATTLENYLEKRPDCLDKIIDKLIRIRYHQMHIKGQLRDTPNSLDDNRPDGNIRDKMPIHDINMDVVSPGLFDRIHLISEPSKIC